jgi:hypothetical protein
MNESGTPRSPGEMVQIPEAPEAEADTETSTTLEGHNDQTQQTQSKDPLQQQRKQEKGKEDVVSSTRTHRTSVGHALTACAEIFESRPLSTRAKEIRSCDSSISIQKTRNNVTVPPIRFRPSYPPFLQSRSRSDSNSTGHSSEHFIDDHTTQGSVNQPSAMLQGTHQDSYSNELGATLNVAVIDHTARAAQIR